MFPKTKPSKSKANFRVMTTFITKVGKDVTGADHRQIHYVTVSPDDSRHPPLPPLPPVQSPDAVNFVGNPSCLRVRLASIGVHLRLRK